MLHYRKEVLNMLNFQEQVNDKTRLYHRVNNTFIILAIIGAWVIGSQYSTYEVTGLYSNTETDWALFTAIFGGVSITYTLMYSFIRVSINNYGESVRANYYRHQLLSTKNVK